MNFEIKDGAQSLEGLAEWPEPDDRARAALANTIDTTEAGACCIALAAIELSRGLVAARRAETLTGADYYLGTPGETLQDLENSARLEVSGTDTGGEQVLNARLRQKVAQAAAGDSNLPAIASVVGFRAKLILSSDVEVP